MHVGMTGTRDGMTDMQKEAFRAILFQLQPDRLHHGDCCGADGESHDIAFEIGVPSIVHPPSDPKLRAFKAGIETREEKGYFARNRDIVNESEVLIGLPKTSFETKGGTWYTINYGKKSGRPVYIIKPDGTIEKHN